MLEITTRQQDNAFIILLDGRIDASSAKDLEQQCLSWIDSGHHDVILDFSSVSYISSAGLRVFLLIAKRVNAVKGRLRLSAMNSIIKDVFEISGFSKLFAIYPTLEDALSG